MKSKLFLGILISLFITVAAFSQTNTGTLKIFAEEPVIVYVDQIEHVKYDAITLVAGTHYVKVTLPSGTKLYSQVVTIVKDQVTSLLMEITRTEQAATPAPAAAITVKAANKTLDAVKSMQQTGTLNIFCELTDVSVYLNESKQGDDIKTIKDIPAGNHYLKVIKDGTSVFGELITIRPGEVTTVLVKNDGQVAEKIMQGKVAEREEYQAKKIDILLTSNSVSTTTGNSMYFPGYYSYYGVSKSVTNTQQISDFKIVQGGVTEIGDIKLASLVDNQAILKRNAEINTSIQKTTTVGALVFLTSMAIGIPLIIDQLGEKHFLHKDTPIHPNWEAGVLAGCVITGTISYFVTMNAEKQRPKHFYRVQDAAADAQKYNKKLKEDLGLPESYDVK